MRNMPQEARRTSQKEAVLEELEAVAEGLVCDGEQRKQRHGRRHSPEEPCIGAILSLSHHLQAAMT